MKPANRSLDRKRYFIIAFIVILFFSNSFIRGRAGQVSLLGRLHTTFHKKKVFFSGGKKFGHVHVACNFGNFRHVYMLMLLT